MKWLVRSIPLVALLSLVAMSCTTTTNTTVVNSLAPTITGFSPDTVWTYHQLRIYGTHFSYDPQNVRITIDTALVYPDSTEDTLLTVHVPENARTGFVHVWSYEQTATSAKQVVIKYTFSPHYNYDTVALGGSFSIPGTGMNNSQGNLRLYVAGILFPIDSIFPDRIVSHAIPNSYSGAITLYDSAGTYSAGALTITRPCTWRTLSEIWDNLTLRESHRRTGYMNGPSHPIDSTWQTFATYNGQVDTNIAGTLFWRNTQGVQYILRRNQPNNYPLLGITWDTVHQTAQISFYKYLYIPTTPYHSGDTVWSGYQLLPAPLPVDGDIEFTPTNFGYTIIEDSTDSQGLVNWQETTNATIVSGAFDIILKQ